MALDLSQTAAQLHGAAPHFSGQRSAQLEALVRAAEYLRHADADAIEQRRLDGKTTFLAAGLTGAMAATWPAPPLANDHVVVAVDGSHIDVDRHSPVRCFLINTGYVTIRYGELPSADLASTPRLFVGDDEMSIRNPAGNREQPIEGPVLGMLRAVMEIEGLVDLVEAAPPELPVLALLDGSLILWELAGGAFPDYVRKALLDDRLLPALDRLQELGRTRTVAVASQVS
ncbi:MAG: DNA double-strand break repair nuclease NurA, partial [Chloroflexi bacterium]|nr:DNA double-strand break repair nuclease NurA [Chloroflexota bacterium]